MPQPTFLKAAMRHLLSVILAFTFIAAIQPQAHAAKIIKAAKPVKERLVLMPLRVPDEDKNLLGSMETALVQGMQTQYEVFSGEQVATKAKAIFNKESLKKVCDETRCMQDIAIAFQAELIATANVTKRDGGYFMALSIQNIFDNKVVYSNSVACESCTTFQVVNKLKELSGAPAQVSAAPAILDLPTPISAASKNDPEAVLWAESQKGNTIDDYQVYLDIYPKGKYLPFAKARIKKLQDQVAETTQQEQSAWGNANSTATEASYQDYLNSYPKGQYATQATARIANIAKIKKEASPFSADGTEFTDKKTGLIWRRCSEGMVYSGGTCTGEASEFTYEEALQHAKSEASRTGIAWRVPEKDELEGIIDKKYEPTIDPTNFPATPKVSLFNRSKYWSATYTKYAWFVSFGEAMAITSFRSSSYYVRLVRAGQ